MNIEYLYLPKRVTYDDVIEVKNKILIEYNQKFNIKKFPIGYMQLLCIDLLMEKFEDEDYIYVKNLVIKIIK